MSNHVEAVVRPLRRAVQLGDVARINLVGPAGDQFGFDRRRVSGPPATFTGPATGAQQPVARGLRAQVDALVQQGRPHLGRCQSNKPVAVQHVQDDLAFPGAQRARL